MKSSQGYYSIVQYTPDPSRQEALNLGVVLFGPREAVFKQKLSTDTERLRRLFEGVDQDLFQAEREALVERLTVHATDFASKSDFENFIARRTGKLRLTALRSIAIEDPDTQLEELFKRLVQIRVRDPGRRPARELFERQLQKAGVRDFVQRQIEVRVPSLALPVRVPFAYKNGRFNLIDPVNLTTSNAWATACRHAVEGKKVYELTDRELGKMQLVVVAQFNNETRNLVDPIGTVMHEHSVKFYPLDQVSPLIDDIKRHAGPLT